MITYHVIVAMTNLLQVEIKSDEGLEYPEIKKRACEKACQENGDYEKIEVEDYEVAV